MGLFGRIPSKAGGVDVVDQLPNLGREAEMLAIMGLSSMDDLFSDIPEDVRRTSPLDLPLPQTEEEIWKDATRLLGANIPINSRPSFIGGGLYANHVPAMVPMMATRGEFLTSYTPYQPEVSQGMLQAMWEFQTMVSELVGLPVSNVSMYDASTAAAEAITTAVRVVNRKVEQKDTVFISELIPEHRLSVIENYTQGGGIILKKLAHDEDGHLNLESLKEAAGSCAIYVEQPNAFGIADEGIAQAKSIIGENTALIVGVNTVSLGLMEAPGNYGADIVVGEGQPFGIGPTAGGPIYGIFACKENFIRQMPGRIVGLSHDSDGQRAFTLTLSTREQHIRRHKATSNICSNETLIALMGAMHMALLGPAGLEKLAIRNSAAMMKTKEGVSSIEEVSLAHPNSSHFNEFVIRLPNSAKSLCDFLDQRGISPGIPIDILFPNMDDNLILVTCTDQTSESDVKLLTAGIKAWVQEASQ